MLAYDLRTIAIYGCEQYCVIKGENMDAIVYNLDLIMRLLVVLAVLQGGILLALIVRRL